MAEAGHNSGVNATLVKEYAQRVQNLVEDRREVNESIKEVFAEAKSQGCDVKALRKAITLLNLPKEDRDALDLYATALGVFG